MTGDRQTRVALVTGCSSGIGLACAERLALAGWRVIGASRRMPAARTWRHLAIDVRDEGSVERGVAAALGETGRIDGLVHCAGNSLSGAVEDVTVEEARAQLETNYFGAVRMVRAVLPVMRRERAGRILVIGSIGGLIGLPFLAHYSASKFALQGFIEALRSEVAPFGIEACVVNPGDFRTAIADNQVLGQACRAGSAYEPSCGRTLAIYDEAVRGGQPPEIVASAVVRLLARRRLPVQAIVGSPLERAGVGLKRMLPGRAFERILQRVYRLQRVDRTE